MKARYLTDHAARRARERHRWNRAKACQELGRAVAVGILIPVRYWHRVSHPSHIDEHDMSRNVSGAHIRGVHIRVLASVVVVISGSAVITTWRLSLEQLVDVLVWVTLGVWP